MAITLQVVTATSGSSPMWLSASWMVGSKGSPTSPNLTIHEALSHIGEDPEVSVTTCKVIAKAGYRIGERVVRAAQVLVVDPGERDEAPAAQM